MPERLTQSEGPGQTVGLAPRGVNSGRDICGGSRSRAFGLTGDPFETDPWCSYEPLRTDEVGS
jgi:MoaA/NifB/PqqE/SkfB family radical SAM enzyme